MATVAQVSLAEYLRTDYEPPRELIGGELVPKPMGTLEHMSMERRLARMLEVFEHRGLGHVMHELSWRNADEVRIPDVVFYRSGARMQDGILIDPPLLAIEILSPSQRQSELFAKCEAYHAWGAPCCWVIDPSTKTAWEYHCGETVESKKDLLTAGEITISIADLFA